MIRPSATRIRSTVRAALVAALLLALRTPAGAVEHGSYSMEILIDGRPIAEYAGRGRTYIEALEGREYSVRLSNHTGGRIAVALSVDGLNSIDAATTNAAEAAKWILEPYQVIVIDGWQTSSENARRFYFTSETASYGAWLGKTDDLGVIAAAVFRERPRPALKLQRRIDAPASSQPRPMEAPKSVPSGEMRQERDREAGAAAESQAPLSDELAATGIGREVDHSVTWVRFDAEAAAAANLELRYEYHAALIRLGVLPAACPPDRDRLARREQSQGFREPGFAPDPYRRGGCR
jgi:hypothetical protein